MVYEKDRQKLGPVSETNLRELVRSGILSGDNLVWTARFGSDWKAINTTEIMEKPVGPPPLPPTHIDNTFAWVIAFLPLAGAVIELAISQRATVPAVAVIICYMLAYVVLVTFDVRRIKLSGNSTDTTSFQNWWIIIPVYLFKRANALKQSKSYFWTWIGAIVLSAAVSGEASSCFIKNTYWGSSLPACDSNYMKTQTQKIFSR